MKKQFVDITLRKGEKAWHKFDKMLSKSTLISKMEFET